MNEVLFVVMNVFIIVCVFLILSKFYKFYRMIVLKQEMQIIIQQNRLIDYIVEEAVRISEEDSKHNSLTSEDKEELALTRIKKLNIYDTGILELNDENILRLKIKSIVNRIYNEA